MGPYRFKYWNSGVSERVYRWGGGKYKLSLEDRQSEKYGWLGRGLLLQRTLPRREA